MANDGFPSGVPNSPVATPLPLMRQAKTGAYTVVNSDHATVIDCTSGTFTLALTAAALMAGIAFWAINSGSGTVTLDPDAAETILLPNGTTATTFALGRGQGAMLQSNGTGWEVLNDTGVMRSLASTWTATQTIRTNGATPLVLTRTDASGADQAMLSLSTTSGGVSGILCSDMALANPDWVWTSNPGENIVISPGTTTDKRFYFDATRLTINANTIATSSLPVPPANTYLRLVNSNGATPRLMLDGYGTRFTLLWSHCNGTAAAPTQGLAADVAAELRFRSYGTDGVTPAFATERAFHDVFLAENWTLAAQGWGQRLYYRPAGTAGATVGYQLDPTGASLFGSTAPIGAERARFNGGTIAAATSSDVVIGGGALAIGATTVSSSTTTGALIVGGGAGIAGALYAGRGVINGVLQVTGNTPLNGTGHLRINPAAVSTQTPVMAVFTGAANTNLGANTEVSDFIIDLNRTVQFANGTVPTQRAVLIRSPAYTFVSSGSVSKAATLAIEGSPTGGSVAVSYAFWCQNGPAQFDGGLGIGDARDIALGTTTGTKIGTATTQKLGFWNKAPVVQPATTGTSVLTSAGLGTALKSDSTTVGNTGSTAYSVSDIVSNLKACGILAA